MLRRRRSAIRVDRIERRSQDGFCELSARVHGFGRGEEFRLWFRVPSRFGDLLTSRADPFLAAVLPSAVRLRRPLEIAGEVSARLAAQLHQVMEIWYWADARQLPIPVRLAATVEARPRGDAVGCFFSGGVDSFYTLLENLDRARGAERVTHLLCVLGFDLDHDHEEMYAIVLDRLRRVAGELGLALVPVRTNQRALTDRFAHWQWKQMGAGLASVGLALGPLLHRALIPAGDLMLPSVLLAPSHPLVDPLFSTEATEFVHHGCEATRLEKVERRIAGSDLALRHLRVCYANLERGNPLLYNCGRCPKCVRTMVELCVAGALERCATFDGARPTPELVRTLGNDAGHPAVYVEASLRALERGGRDPELQAHLRAALRRARSPKRRLEQAWKRCLLRPARRVVYGLRRRLSRRP